MAVAGRIDCGLNFQIILRDAKDFGILKSPQIDLSIPLSGLSILIGGQQVGRIVSLIAAARIFRQSIISIDGICKLRIEIKISRSGISALNIRVGHTRGR